MCRRVRVAELHARAAVVLFSSWSQRRPIDHFSTHAKATKDDADVGELLVGDSHARGLGSRAVFSIFGAFAARPELTNGGGILSQSACRAWAVGRQLCSTAFEEVYAGYQIGL